VSEPGEWLRIQPRGEGYKQGGAEGDRLRVGHEWRGRIAGLFQPGVNDYPEIIVDRGNEIERGEDGQHRMMRFDEREKDEVLAHEAPPWRYASQRKHEDEEKNGSGGLRLVEAVEIVEFVADNPALAQRR